MERVCSTLGLSTTMRHLLSAFAKVEDNLQSPTPHASFFKPTTTIMDGQSSIQDKLLHGNSAPVLETMYILRYAEHNGTSRLLPWSMRQTLICQVLHQSSSRSQWLLVAPSTKIELCVEQNASIWTSRGQELPHLLLLRLATSSYRIYLLDLTRLMRQQVCS